jgi:dihydropyrimidinase
MPQFDLAIRGGTIVTAADIVRCDIGIADGRIASLARDISDAREVIDASELLVMPGGIDSHVHLAQLAYGAQMADDFESGSRSAVAGGNTTILPFSLQPRGKSLRQSVMDYHKLADGKCYVDYGFHLIISDPTPTVLGQELPALVADGYPSFKVFMTYDDLVLNDRQLLEVFECARRKGARDGSLRRLHAIVWRPAPSKQPPNRALLSCVSRPEIVERGYAQGNFARGTAGCADHDCACPAAGDGQIRWARSAGLRSMENVSAIYFTDCRRSEGTHMDESGQVCLFSTAPRSRELEGYMGGYHTGRV